MRFLEHRCPKCPWDGTAEREQGSQCCRAELLCFSAPSPGTGFDLEVPEGAPMVNSITGHSNAR